MYNQPASTQTIVTAGELRLSFERTKDGIILLNLVDVSTGQEFFPSKTLPLFTVKMRNVKTGQEKHISSDSGWDSVSIDKSDSSLAMSWKNESLIIEAHGDFDDYNSALYWTLKADNKDTDWSIMSVIFPQIAVADLGANGCVFFPRGPGEVQKNLWNRSFRHTGFILSRGLLCNSYLPITKKREFT